VVVQRPEGTGARYIWTAFLFQSMPEFRARTTGTKQRDWGEITAPKSKDVVARSHHHTRCDGSVERSFAASSGLAYGDVQNRSGKFVPATAMTIRAAFKAKGNPSSDFSLALANAEADDAHPLVSFAWAYVACAPSVPGVVPPVRSTSHERPRLSAIARRCREPRSGVAHSPPVI
jgi:ABC-type phosphate transport system substrate-binding protein